MTMRFLVVASGISQCDAHTRLFPLTDQKPKSLVKGFRPVRFDRQDLGIERPCFGWLSLGVVQGSGAQQGLEILAVTLTGDDCPCADRFEDAGTLRRHIGDCFIHPLLLQDAGQLLEDAGRSAAPFDLDKGGCQLLDPLQAVRVGVLYRLAQALTFFPVGSRLGLGQLAPIGFLYGLSQVFANLLRTYYGDLCHIARKGLIGPPAAATQNHQEKQDGKHDEVATPFFAFLLLAQLSQVIP
ncbi:hypothetical protein [Azotobacter chroococcum]|uniref:hypothetical protein n=1 Tax=Azotobacter chroococcum TaxID=353 RepID=UPI001EEFECF9|nr:hypothetical protein [Azotobacter chroococcum]